MSQPNDQLHPLQVTHKIYADDFLERLKSLLDAQLESRRNLDKKAWDILSLSSGSITLAITIQVGLLHQHINGVFLRLLIILSVIYIGLVLLVWVAVRPRKWSHVPGTADLGQDSFLSRYLDLYYGQYVGQLVADYVGKDGKPGAITQAQCLNDTKALYVNAALFFMALITINLICCAFALALDL